MRALWPVFVGTASLRKQQAEMMRRAEIGLMACRMLQFTAGGHGRVRKLWLADTEQRCGGLDKVLVG